MLNYFCFAHSVYFLTKKLSFHLHYATLIIYIYIAVTRHTHTHIHTYTRFTCMILCRNHLCWRYQTLVQTLERKRMEVELLSSEFESKLRTKEVQTHSHSHTCTHSHSHSLTQSHNHRGSPHSIHG